MGSGMDMDTQIRGATSINGSNSPLYLLDGMPVDAAAINSIPAADVETIEVLKGGQAAIYGSQAAGGVIAVYTKRGNVNYDYSKEPAPGTVTLRLPGYYRAREFYAPRYDTPKQAPRPDPRRTTLYWNPRVRTGADGQAQLTFFTSDESGTFRMVAEGLTASGQPSMGAAEIKVDGK
jgi:TonB-dependent SusC/RagA subfamily outer membrane receptor